SARGHEQGAVQARSPHDGLAADSKARYVEIAADQPTRALIRRAQLAQCRAALAGALSDDAHQTGRAPVTGVVAAHHALRGMPGRQARGTVVLLVAAGTLRVIDERIAAGTIAARARRIRITLQIGRGQVLL